MTCDMQECSSILPHTYGTVFIFHKKFFTLISDTLKAPQSDYTRNIWGLGVKEPDVQK